MTEALFYADPYLREADAQVCAVVTDERHGPGLVLDRTVCHPHGGGQKGDRATLVLPSEVATALGLPTRLPLVDTRKGADGAIVHIPGLPLPEGATAALPAAGACRLELDWAFRWRQMRLHSAAHLLHCFVGQVLGTDVAFPETSDLQPDFGLNRYERKDLLDQAQLTAVLSQVNAFTAAGQPITTWPDAERPGFRHWRCGDWVIPCGGTHPADAVEIGPLTADLGLKRGRTSLTFRLAAG